MTTDKSESDLALLDTLKPLDKADQDFAYGWFVDHGYELAYLKLRDNVATVGPLKALAEMQPGWTMDIELRLWAALAFRCLRELRGCN